MEPLGASLPRNRGEVGRDGDKAGDGVVLVRDGEQTESYLSGFSGGEVGKESSQPDVVWSVGRTAPPRPPERRKGGGSGTTEVPAWGSKAPTLRRDLTQPRAPVLLVVAVPKVEVPRKATRRVAPENVN